MNQIFKRCAVLFLLLALLAGTALAALPEKLIPGGQAIGLQLQTDGVSIVELAQDNPCAREAGLRRGDVIRAIDGERVSTVRQVTAAVSASDGQALTIRYERGGKAAETAVQPQRTADGWRLGVFVRDSITGIGTVTYYDPENGTFGALGHGVCDSSALLPLRSGLALPAAVTSVTRGEVGTPGALHGAVTGRSPCGTIRSNTERGIFGTMAPPQDISPLPTAAAAQVHTGSATILSNVSGTETREYAVQIVSVEPDEPQGRNLRLAVTDDALLAQTGGIVQGMSGSPILQNGRLVGAVTHVLVNDPTRGYGIFAQTMLEQAHSVPGRDAAA